MTFATGRRRLSKFGKNSRVDLWVAGRPFGYASVIECEYPVPGAHSLRNVIGAIVGQFASSERHHLHQELPELSRKYIKN
jgi:hypothetical protein